MDDIRKTKYGNRLKRRANISGIIAFIIKNWLKIFAVVIILCILFYPETVGSVVGEWFHKLVSSFIKKLTF